MEDDNDAGTLLYLCGCSPTTTNRGNDDDDDVLERNAVLDSTSWLRKRKETEHALQDRIKLPLAFLVA